MQMAAAKTSKTIDAIVQCFKNTRARHAILSVGDGGLDVMKAIANNRSITTLEVHGQVRSSVSMFRLCDPSL
jgi:hypothetical protein